MLNPGGLLFIDEYIGPSCYGFSRYVIELINRQLIKLPSSLVLSRQPVTKKDFSDLWLKGKDHSEGIRSARLEKSLHKHFNQVCCDFYGGTLLQPFFLTTHLNPCRLNIPNWHQSKEGAVALTELINLENQLIENGILKSDYAFFIFSRKS